MVLAPSDLSSRVALSVGTFTAVMVAYKLLWGSRIPKGAHAPRRAPTSHWLLGDLPALLENGTRFHDWVLETTRACDEQPWLHSAPLMPDMIVLTTPETIEEVTRTQFDSFGKGDFTRELAVELFGNSLFSVDGPSWFHQRKTAVRFFTARMYREVAAPSTHEHVARFVAKLEQAKQDQASINLTGVINAFALQNFAELAFGLDIKKTDPMPLHIALENSFVCVLHRMHKPMWLWKLQRWLNVGVERKYRESTSFVRSFVMELVHDSLEKSMKDDQVQPKTLVELFVQAKRKGHDEFTPELLCDLAILFLTAGRDTTVAALEWFFYSLSKNPDAELKIREELWAQVPELMDGTIETLSVEQTHKLVYLEAAILETMRLYPAPTLAPRQALRDTVLIDGTFVPKGVHVGMAPYTMARLTSVWGDDAAAYKPDRFIDTETGRLLVIPQSKFFSFGAGARSCIGRHLAMLEMKMLIAAIFKRFRLEIAPNDGRCKFSSGIVIDTPLQATVHAAPSPAFRM